MVADINHKRNDNGFLVSLSRARQLPPRLPDNCTVYHLPSSSLGMLNAFIKYLILY
jgi:hypothetical protein